MHDQIRAVRGGAPHQPRIFVVKSGTDLTEPEVQLIRAPAIRSSLVDQSDQLEDGECAALIVDGATFLFL